MDKWIDIDRVADGDIKDILSCDTRDFHIFTCENEDNTLKLNTDDELSLFEKDEIIPFLKSIKHKLIVENKYFHRMNVLHYNIPENVEHYNGWVKYIRFMKLENGKYVMYTTLGDNRYILSRKYINPDNLNMKYI